MPSKKYFLVNASCPKCSSIFETFNGGQNKREFCSKSCAMRSRKISEENKKNISESLVIWNSENKKSDYICKYNQEIKFCKYCKSEFKVYSKK